MFEQIDMSWCLPCNCGRCQNYYLIVALNPWGCESFAPSPTEFLCGCYLSSKPSYYPHGRKNHGEIDHKWDNWLCNKMEELDFDEDMGVEYGCDWRNMCPGFRLKVKKETEEILI